MMKNKPKKLQIKVVYNRHDIRSKPRK